MSARRWLMYRASFLIECLVMCGLLGNDTDLREAVAMALRLALPASLQTSLVQMVLSPEAFPMPHQSSISRWRVLVDSAYMMWCREHLLPAGHIRYLMLDSSTQGGRDMEMLVVGSIARGDLEIARQMAEDLLLVRWAKGLSGATGPNWVWRSHPNPHPPPPLIPHPSHHPRPQQLARHTSPHTRQSTYPRRPCTHLLEPQSPTQPHHTPPCPPPTLHMVPNTSPHPITPNSSPPLPLPCFIATQWVVLPPALPLARWDDVAGVGNTDDEEVAELEAQTMLRLRSKLHTHRLPLSR